jgi:excisionase family DNA binding protein
LEKQFMQYREAAPLLGLTATALYNLIRSGSVPAVRIGGARGRWYVNANLVRERLVKLMEQNIKTGDNDTTDDFLFQKLRRIGG